jgi:phage head maturation protease
MADEYPNAPGAFLKACRLRLDPTSFGFITGRRRTPGLRREEVAQLANISPTGIPGLSKVAAARRRKRC